MKSLEVILYLAGFGHLEPLSLVVKGSFISKADLPGVGNSTRTHFVGMQKQVAIAIRESGEYDEI